MKTMRMCSASFGWSTLFLGFLLVRMGSFAQDTSRFFEAIQPDTENEALAMLESNTNLVRAFNDRSIHPLLQAAAVGHARLVRRMLELGADVDVQGDTLMSAGSQATALHWAVRGNHYAVCRVLLEAGADPNRMAFGYETPLHRALKDDREDIANLLLDYGADPFQGKLFVNDETTPFELAITKSSGHLVPRMLGQDPSRPLGLKSLQKARQMKETSRGRKTSAEVLSSRGVELAISAAQRGELEALTALLRAGVSIEDANRNCPTILQGFSIAALEAATNYAGVASHRDQIESHPKANYFSSSDPGFAGSQHSSASKRLASLAPDRRRKILDLLVAHGADYDAFAATALGDTAHVKLLIAGNEGVAQARNCKGETPLHWAIHSQEPSMVALWISAGVPLDGTNSAGQTALHLAAIAGKSQVLKTLLAANSSTTTRDTNGWRALEAAIQKRQADSIRRLMASDSGVSRPERGLSTPLHAAAASGDVDALAAHMKAATALDPRNELGLTPLHVAVTAGHFAAAAFLVDKGADITLADPDGNNLLHQVLLQERLIIRDGPPRSWVQRAAKDPGNVLYVQNLTGPEFGQGPNPILQAASFALACGCNPSATNRAGYTPLRLITDQKLSRGVFFFDDDRDKLLKLLVSKGGNLDERDADGNTALHRLCTGYYDIQKVETMGSLIAVGANVNATNNLGQTPLHLAAQHIGMWDGNDPPVNAPFQLLIYKRADVNARDKEGRTPLQVVLDSDSIFRKEASRLLTSAGARSLR